MLDSPMLEKYKNIVKDIDYVEIVNFEQDGTRIYVHLSYKGRPPKRIPAATLLFKDQRWVSKLKNGANFSGKRRRFEHYPPPGFFLYKFCRADTEEVLYIGKTNNLRLRTRRSHEHWHDTYITKYSEFSNESDRNIMEMYYIAVFSPVLNTESITNDIPTFVLPEIEWKTLELD